MQNLAQIVGITQPMVDGETLSVEEFVAYAARVSNPANQNNYETAERLCAYMIRNHHWSPFEMVSVTMEINTTRDIARQILRHRSFSFQEFSQRYSSDVCFADPREARLQDQKNRQNSIDEGVDPNVKTKWEMWQNRVMKEAATVYQEALDMGIAKEVARSVLPEGLTESRLYMAGTLRSWMHYVNLRSSNGTQKEHMTIACVAKNELENVFPNIMAALEKSHV